MQRSRWGLIIFIAGLIAGLSLFTGCTTGHDSSNDGGGGGGSSSGDNGNPAGGGQAVALFGTFDDAGVFQNGTIKASNAVLSSGESTELSVNLVGADNTGLSDSTDVFFSSDCTRQGLADIAPAVVTNSDGNISTTYTALGCEGKDVVTARTSIDGATLTAKVTVTTSLPRLGALQFSGASPQQIGIRGTGILPEQSSLTFTVTDANGQPVPNQRVDFSLDTAVGGLKLNRTSAMTDSSGQAVVIVTAGTQATTAQVRARSIGSNGVTVSARSNVLAVTTGAPDNDSFSVSAETPNIEGWSYDGTSTQITVRAADRFNNPVPNGTAVNFTTEGGSIPGSCVTQDGVCSVTFTAQDPRPENGRVTIRATAIGEESFVDSNPSNGRYDPNESFTDLPEAFRDDNENGRWDNNEPYLNFNSEDGYTEKDQKFSGLLCKAGDKCATSPTINVRRNIVVVLSGSSLNIGNLPGSISLAGGPVTIQPTVFDVNGQVPPADTTVEASVTQGELDGTTSYTVRPTNAPGPYRGATFHILPGNDPGSGLLRITVTTPKGTISRANVAITQ
ncbi:Ig-like domain-containing protein [Salinisphaera sp.]|uniref:Ig-like domain-containing protein n=1 Tax=Salinisphaera sp. TaxID=1914330 RepID=UPI002D786C9D|nr:Ig-like domain-containing protein [Salinisphaera sp.]HET7314873.1 Ig-like domain-containing protein [Salinisphaera sp.]